MLTLFINYDFSVWASESNLKTYSIDSVYKNSFLLSTTNSIQQAETNISQQEIKPNVSILFLSLLFPGLGQIMFGENISGYTFLIFGIIPILTILLPLLISSGSSEMSHIFYSFVFMLSSFVFVVIYVASLINAFLIGLNYSKNNNKDKNSELIIDENKIGKILEKVSFNNNSVAYQLSF